MSTIPVSLFLKRLEQSNLLGADELRDVRNDIERVGSAIQTESLGRRLVNEKRLTKWHVQMLTSGKYAFFLGKYKLLDLLGQGGMGVVFKAEQAGLGRIVAIKVLSKERMSNPTIVQRFHREIQAAAHLNNPHVVIAYDADCVKDTHFLVMEYVEGIDLATVIMHEGKLHVEEACEYIRQAALGLQHAHDLGMVHRDIKPSNLIVTRRGQTDTLVKILDMGLARFVSEQMDEKVGPFPDKIDGSGLTVIGQVMGTPDYMSPEQAWNTSAVDIRSDIYSLGCTLYLLLTGRFAFPGETATDKVLARTSADALPVSTFEPDATPALDAVVSKMLAREPAERYQTPAEVARALEPFCVLPADVLTLATEEGMPVATTDAVPPPEAVSTVDVPETQPDQRTAEIMQEPTRVDAVPAGPAPTFGDGEEAPTIAVEAPVVFDGAQDMLPFDARLESFLTDLATEASGDRSSQTAKKKTGRPHKRDGAGARKRRKKRQPPSRRPRPR